MRPLVDIYGLCGHCIDGNLDILEVIGEGGFGVVYRAMHLGIGEPVAVKCLKLAEGTAPDVAASFTQRFFDECRIAYRLSQGSLSIVRSVGSGTTLSPTTGQSVPYMVLEWLEGTSLSVVLKRRRAERLPGMSLPDVVTLFEPAAAALAHAHAAGIAHRDVKPGNLFLAKTPNGDTLKVLDFGMAKVFDVVTMGFSGAATIGGLLVVSPQFAAPEQFEAASNRVGPWSDVFSLALVMVEALVGRRARTANGVGECMVVAHDARKIPTPRSFGVAIADPVEAVFAAALAIDPMGRPRDAREFWARLTTAIRSAADLAADPFEVMTMVDSRPPDSPYRVSRPPSFAGNDSLPHSQRATHHQQPLATGARTAVVASDASPLSPRFSSPMSSGRVAILSPEEVALILGRGSIVAAPAQPVARELPAASAASSFAPQLARPRPFPSLLVALLLLGLAATALLVIGTLFYLRARGH